MVQLLPGAEDSVISAIEKNMTGISSVSSMIQKGMKAEEIIGAVFDGVEFELFDEFDTDYICTCSRERYLSAIAGLSANDIKELTEEDKPIEAVCHFCNKKYTFSSEEVLKKYSERIKTK